jgi:putative exporter of polyketide antibiotics
MSQSTNEFRYQANLMLRDKLQKVLQDEDMLRQAYPHFLNETNLFRFIEMGMKISDAMLHELKVKIIKKLHHIEFELMVYEMR